MITLIRFYCLYLFLPEKLQTALMLCEEILQDPEVSEDLKKDAESWKERIVEKLESNRNSFS